MLRLALHAMGTRFELVLEGGNDTRLRAAGEEALEEIRRLDRRLSAFRSDSVIAELNRSAADRPVRVDPETIDLLRLCEEVWRESNGAFDVTIAPLMEAWGFRGDSPRLSIEAARERCGMQHVVLDETRREVRFARGGVRLDLGGIGKGFALDAACAVLREAGVESAFLHGGTSSVATIGAPSDGGAWKVALRDPAEPDQTFVTLSLRDQCLAVSAPHGRTVSRIEGEHGHVLDPRSGAPSRVARLAAVVARSAALADAWSTALLVLGRERSLELDPPPGTISALVLAAEEPTRVTS